jgi:CRP/FNR family transcriptional regulator, nitrogen oxide reductase regulator
MLRSPQAEADRTARNDFTGDERDMVAPEQTSALFRQPFAVPYSNTFFPRTGTHPASSVGRLSLENALYWFDAAALGKRCMATVDSSLVAHLPMFAGFGPDELADILREARSTRYAKTSTVFEQGQDAHSFFLLLHGHIRAAKTTPAGEQVVVRYVAPGEIFGVAPAIGLARYPATATAVDDSVVLSWPATAWPRLVARFPALAANTLQAVGSRLQESHTRVVEMSTQQVEQRIAHALLRLAKQSGRKLDRGVEIDFPISRQDIAQMTGTTLHTVSRILSGWEQLGLIESGRQRIVLREPHKIFVLAEHSPSENEPGG